MNRAERIEKMISPRLINRGWATKDLPEFVAEILAIADAREIMSLKDVADMLTVNRTTILSWVARGTHDFPQPFTVCGAGQLWDGEQVRAWASTHPQVLPADVATAILKT